MRIIGSKEGSMIKTYYTLTKPGILFGNAITAAAGFFLASKGQIDCWLLGATLLGLSLIIASACVCNNYIDRNADEKMTRTKNRALVTGEISVRSAILFAIVLILLGSVVLFSCTNLLSVFTALAGFFVYVVLYSIWKYRSVYGILVGSIAGGVPPVVGYCAVSQRLDLGALLVFLMIVLWQMPHFFAIAIYRCSDYAAAAIPVFPVKRGLHSTKIQMLLYIVAFILVTSLLTLLGYTGYLYLVVAALLGGIWLGICVTGFTCSNDLLWARKMFFFSLIIVVMLSAAMAWDVVGFPHSSS